MAKSFFVHMMMQDITYRLIAKHCLLSQKKKKQKLKFAFIDRAFNIGSITRMLPTYFKITYLKATSTCYIIFHQKNKTYNMHARFFPEVFGIDMYQI